MSKAMHRQQPWRTLGAPESRRSGLFSVEAKVDPTTFAPQLQVAPQLTQHQAAGEAAAQPEAAPVSASAQGFLGWVGSFFGWRGEGAAPAPLPPASSQASFLDTSASEGERQDPRLTSSETMEERQHAVFIGDAFGSMESEDSDSDDRLRRLDRAARVIAETPEKAAPAAPGAGVDPLRAGGAHASSFWETMSDEDADIEASLAEGKDLNQYQQLTKVQNAQIDTAVHSVQQGGGPGARIESSLGLHHGDKSAEAIRLAGTWSELETEDHKKEDHIKHDPNLQMLQVDVNLRGADARVAGA